MYGDVLENYTYTAQTYHYIPMAYQLRARHAHLPEVIGGPPIC